MILPDFLRSQAYFGRRALVGQFVLEPPVAVGKKPKRIDCAERINFERSRRYQPNGERECARRRAQLRRLGLTVAVSANLRVTLQPATLRASAA